MFKIIKKELEWCGKKLAIETGRFARLTNGAVLITYGDTSVLCTVAANKSETPNVDFLPLTVHYREMAFAAGKIPGGFFKREGKPSEKEVLTSRIVDRVIRPLFPEGFYHDIQVVCTVLSHDGETDSDIISIIGASAALMISGIPFLGPVGATRVGYIDNEFVFNASLKDADKSALDLAVAGTYDSILMVEAGAAELSEEKMLEALELGQKNFQPVIKLIEQLKEEAGKEEFVAALKTTDKELEKKVRAIVEKDLIAAYKEISKQIRRSKIDEAKAALLEKIDLEEHSESEVLALFKLIQKDIVRGNILKSKTRIDGRDLETVRPILAEVSVFPRVHGSSLFTRGETQAFVVATLGGTQDEQIMDTLTGDTRERFMLHYNFPSYSVGEVSPMRPPGRREIGHGKLAWRAIYGMLPSKEEFPYTIRVVAEITESNGSSSQATVCGASLALMDAGVPLKKPVAGIAMGLIKEGAKFAVLSDILGDEDFLGDMDFKVAGTKDGITALQMDIKVAGINHDIMKIALSQAKDGRLHILDKMSEALSSSRENLSKFAPTITSLNVPKDKIGVIIGPGGKTIKDICEKTGVKIDIDDNGVVSIAAVDSEASKKASEMVMDLISEVKVGEIYEGVVTKILDFGAVVSFLGKKEGLLHISEISDTRIKEVSDVLKENDVVKVKVIDIDPRKKKIKLSMKKVSGDNSDSDGSEEKTHQDRGNSGNKRNFDERRDDRPRHGSKEHSRDGNRDKDRDQKKSKSSDSQQESSSIGKKMLKYFNL